ncbi:MAG: hypothetical protein KJ064_02735 [Anaerolineae bacterium]|nr:hypothetical protein [Anaerolineae bacterium]
MSNRRVLVVDEKQDTTLHLQTLLDSVAEGEYTVAWTDRPDKGLSLLANQSFAAALVAQQIGQKSGVELIALAVSNGVRVPLILLAENSDRQLDRAARNAGAADFLNRQALDSFTLEHVLDYAIARTRMMDELRLVDEQFRALLRHVPMNIFAVSRDGVTLFSEGKPNPDMKHIPGRSVYELFDDDPEFLETFQRVLLGEECSRQTEMDGRIYENWYTPIYDSASQVTGMLGISEDITERKWFEETFQHYTSELEARTRELHAYNYTIAHDLKSPLAMVVGYASLADDALADANLDDARKFVREIITAGQTMQNMIDQLLQLASETHIKEKRTMLDVRQVIDTALFRFKYQIETYGIEVDISPDLPPAAGHSPWVEQIFANLISNAIKYRDVSNPHPHIRIRGSHDGTVSRYEVEDNGVGIPPESQKTIFELFGRVHKNVEGSGIGLAIVQRMVKKLDGDIGVVSAAGQGSTFWLTLPASL